MRENNCQELLHTWDDYDVILCESSACADALNEMRLQGEPKGAFGALAQSFDAWIAALWEQNGSAQTLVTPLERRLLCEKAIAVQESELRHLELTPFLPQTLAWCVRFGSGHAGFDAVVSRCAEPKDLDAAERELLDVAACYFELLDAQGLIEQGHALQYAVQREQLFFPHVLRIAYWHGAPLDGRQVAFFEGCQHLDLHEFIQETPRRIERPQSFRPRFVFPSGRYAQGKLMLEVLDEIFEAPVDGAPGPLREGARRVPEAQTDLAQAESVSDLSQSAQTEVILAGKDPCCWFERLAAPLARRGISCSARYRKPLPQTELGRAALLLWQVENSGPLPWDKDALCDLLHNPLMGLAKRTVWKWDARLREDRLLEKQSVLDELRQGSGEYEGEGGYAFFRLLEDVVMRPLPDAFNQMECFLRERLLPLGDEPAGNLLFENLSVLGWMRDMFERLHALDVKRETLPLQLLEDAAVQVSICNAKPQLGVQPQVRIMSQNEASSMRPVSCDYLIICDADTENYPLRDQDDAASLLLRKLDAYQSEPALALARRGFAGLLQLPSRGLFIERCLLNTDAEAKYPNAMVEELVDAYRRAQDREEGRDVDNLFRLPEELQKGLFAAGEYDGMEEHYGPSDLLQAALPGAVLAAGDMRDTYGAQMGFMPGAVCEKAPAPSPLRDFVAFPRGSEHPLTDDAVPVLSPTQMEAYLECPYRWFVERRLAAGSLDEDFGPKNVGTFLHACFERFYERFWELTGERKVTRALMGQARGIMAQVFQEVRAEQAQLRPGHRYAALPGSSEEYDVASLEGQLMKWLEFEARFLRGYAPCAFEFKLNEHLPYYAGARWKGSVDRIDVEQNATGGPSNRFVVIDYKGSLAKPQFKPLNKEGGYAEDGKVQALIYASALRQMMRSAADGVQGETQRGEACSAADELQLGACGQTGSSGGAALPLKCGSEPVAALYVSYKRGNEVSGAYNRSQLSMPLLTKNQAGKMGLFESFLPDEGDVASASSSSASPGDAALEGPPSFQGLERFVERRVSQAVEAMRKGEVRPAPASDDACKYCAVKTCPERRSEYAAY